MPRLPRAGETGAAARWGATPTSADTSHRTRDTAALAGGNDDGHPCPPRPRPGGVASWGHGAAEPARTQEGHTIYVLLNGSHIYAAPFDVK